MGISRLSSCARRLIAVVALFVIAVALGGDLNSFANADAPSGQMSRGKPGDYWADVVIGQPDFTQLSQSRVAPFKVFNPGGVAVDRSVEPGRAYVWDSGNNRVLGMDLAKCYAHDSPCIPDVVLGQPSMYDYSGCNGDSGAQNFPNLAPATAETLCSMPEVSQSPSEHPSFVNMFVDDLGNLYVPDSHNHRVLLFEDPFGTDSVADAVWGQPDFRGFTCNGNDAHNPTASSLCFHSSDTFERGRYGGWSATGVAVGPDGSLWVADPGNNRVLRFPYDAELGRAGDRADLVLGQPDFTSRGRGAGMNQMYAPAAARFDGAGNLLVADAFNERVLKFVPPFTSGMMATGTFGSGFGEPVSIEADPLGRGVWISDLAFSALSLWNPDGAEPLKIIGKDSALDRCRWFKMPGGDGWVEGLAGFGFDNDGNLLFSLAGGGHDVLRIEAPLPDKGEIPASRVKRFFYPPGERNYWDSKDLHWAVGVAVYEDQLIVSDFARLMFWNDLDDLANGQPADGVIGDVHYRRDHASCCGDVKADGAGRLWAMSREGMWGYIDVYDLPLTRQSTPVHTIWTKTADGAPVSFSVLGSSEKVQIENRMFGVAPDAGGKFLWVSDTDNHRVLRIRDPLTNPVVDIILGQTTVKSDECNRDGDSAPAADMLCFPGDLSIDRQGNLWVSDHALEASGNFRLLMFPKNLFPTDNAETIFASDAAKIFTTYGDRDSRMSVGFYEERETFSGGHAGPYAAATFETAFDSENNMAVGFNMYPSGRFVALYQDPASADTGTEPAAYLNDLTSMPFAATFDDDDNLYIGDSNRARVLIYYNPLNNAPANATPSPLPAPLRTYATTITSISPLQPSCVLRDNGMLRLRVAELPASGALTVQIRKIAFSDRLDLQLGHTAEARADARVENGNEIVVDSVWRGLWRHYDRTTAIARLLLDGESATSWSPPFTIADDERTCAKSDYVILPAAPHLSPGPSSLRVGRPQTFTLNTEGPGYIGAWLHVDDGGHLALDSGCATRGDSDGALLSDGDSVTLTACRAGVSRIRLYEDGTRALQATYIVVSRGLPSGVAIE